MAKLGKKTDFDALVHIKAKNVINNHNGTYTIVLPSTGPTQEEIDFVNKLFPYTKDMVYELLEKEILLKAICDVNETQLEPPMAYSKPVKNAHESLRYPDE